MFFVERRVLYVVLESLYIISPYEDVSFGPPVFTNKHSLDRTSLLTSAQTAQLEQNETVSYNGAKFVAA